MRTMAAPIASRNGGMVLIVVLVMLGILTLIVASLLRTSNINFQIAGNQQYRQEARLAAQSAIESYISSPGNFDTPPASNTTYSMDLDGDGNDEYSAVVPPATKVGVTAAPLDSISDVGLRIKCTNDLNQSGSPALDGSSISISNGSNCENVVYDVKATVSDTATTGASVELHQGITRLSKKGS